MTNYNPKSRKNLRPNFKPKWKNRTTKLVRVPVVLEEEILGYAHQLDDGKTSIVTTEIVELLKGIISKIENKEKGYKANSAAQLIKALRDIDATISKKG